MRRLFEKKRRAPRNWPGLLLACLVPVGLVALAQFSDWRGSLAAWTSSDLPIRATNHLPQLVAVAIFGSLDQPRPQDKEAKRTPERHG